MNLTSACAPGKTILFGEHAVVYGQPAIAAPVTQVQACATVEADRNAQGVFIRAADLGLSLRVGDTLEVDAQMLPLQVTVLNTLEQLGESQALSIRVTVSSTVPMARGLGSGAAVATAIVRALAQHLGRQLSPAEVSDLVFRTEILHHGTPSGIDNSVIAYEQPVYFVKGRGAEVLKVGRPFWLVIGDTGVASPTREVVGDVHRRWLNDSDGYEAMFARIGDLAAAARTSIAEGDTPAMGHLMDANQELLRQIGVSSPELEALIGAARRAGALGAKLCGAGRGGNMIALVRAESAEAVASALRQAGATGVIITEVRSPEGHALPEKAKC